jgi:opacity protein-like surface antigen
MRSLLLLMVIIFPAMGFCQQEKSSRRLGSIGIMISPSYSYRTLNFASSNQWIAEMRNDEEVGNFGFTAGFQAHYRLGHKLKFETGLLYSNNGLKTKYEDLTWASSDPELPSRSKTIYRFKYLALPVSVSYSFLVINKMSLFATAGLSANIFLSKKTNVAVTYPDGDNNSHASSKQTGYSRFNLSATIGAGIDYRFSKRITLRAAPFYQRSLTSIVVDNDAKEYLFSFGVNTGIHYTLL